MTNYEIDILKKALLEAERKELNRFKKIPNEDIEFSENFEKNINNLARKRKTLIWQATKTIPRRIAVVFIAAIITFCLLMTVSAIRTPVINFFVNIYEDFIGIFVDAEQPPIEKIDTIYSPTYIPDGYLKTSHNNLEIRVETIWKNENNRIILVQDILNENHKFLDNENSNYSELQLNGKVIYYIQKNGQYTLTWIDNNYLFELNCSEKIEFTEIEKIILSMNIVEN